MRVKILDNIKNIRYNYNSYINYSIISNTTTKD